LQIAFQDEPEINSYILDALAKEILHNDAESTSHARLIKSLCNEFTSIRIVLGEWSHLCMLATQVAVQESSYRSRHFDDAKFPRNGVLSNFVFDTIRLAKFVGVSTNTRFPNSSSSNCGQTPFAPHADHLLMPARD
jgi:hypothetical protein